MSSSNNHSLTTTKIALFKGKQIRKTLHNNEWWFAINDVIESLTDSSDPAQYFKRLKQRDKELAKLTDQGGVQFVPPLMLEVKTDGGKQKMYCWHTESIPKLMADAKAGGDIAGGARKNLEKRLGRSVVSGKNFLQNTEKRMAVKHAPK
ncbi:hypothetical protein BK004_01080 [bacterium CG10_46_32]|nr:MAG: hypothetical protein BK004_01080 [bacterium CG10_46_32]